MQTPADVQYAEQMLQQITQLIDAEDYNQAITLLSKWQFKLQQIFSELEPTDRQLLQQVQQLSDDFLALLPALHREQAKIKDSISQIAAIKSENKIRRTYQIE